ncbi:MAG: YlbF family regulator [Gemmatimonadales bacterium]|nr:MAG: YlbF family regulator [Gemmatimonadales bacterium]
MSKIEEMAKELGEALGRTDEYKALKRAASGLDEDRELNTLKNELQKLEQSLVTQLQAGQEPSEEDRNRYEEMAGDLQSKPEYQRLVAAQSNFDKLLQRVNETISRGIQEGSESRIILPS